MSKKLRPKYMKEREFDEVLKKGRPWIPYKIDMDTLPDWMKNIPKEKLHSVYISGSTNAIKTDKGEEIGGIDIFRKAEEDPVNYNKDHMIIIRDEESDDMLLVLGPFKDHEHWINEIPDRLKNAEIIRLCRDEGC